MLVPCIVHCTMYMDKIGNNFLNIIVILYLNFQRLRIDENQKKHKTDKAVADEDTKEIKKEEPPTKDSEEDKTGNENDILSLQGYR